MTAAGVSQATAGSVRISVREDELELSIVDNGVGLPSGRKRRGGLANIMWRAAELGGACSVTPGDPSGTVLHWVVPLG